MAYKTNFFFLLLVLLLSSLSQLPNVHAGQETNQQTTFHVDKILTLLSDKGYNAMSMTLEKLLHSLIPLELVAGNGTAVTIFCPVDKAFLSSKYPQPPFTLLQYHVAPLKIDKVALESTLSHGSKIDTLLPRHPLVVTGSRLQASINDVKIAEWDIYNDGQVIIHGVEDFFDPAFQTLRYPWYDGGVNDGKNGINGSVVGGCIDDFGGLIFWVKDIATLRVIAFVASLIFVLLLLVYFYLGYSYGRSEEFMYVK